MQKKTLAKEKHTSRSRSTPDRFAATPTFSPSKSGSAHAPASLRPVRACADGYTARPLAITGLPLSLRQSLWKFLPQFRCCKCAQSDKIKQYNSEKQERIIFDFYSFQILRCAQNDSFFILCGFGGWFVMSPYGVWWLFLGSFFLVGDRSCPYGWI